MVEGRSVNNVKNTRNCMYVQYRRNVSGMIDGCPVPSLGILHTGGTISDDILTCTTVLLASQTAVHYLYIKPVCW